MSLSAPTITVAELRACVRAVTARARPAAVLPFGLDAVDRRLATAGLAGDALHEAAPASASLSDEAAATLFLAGMAARFAGAQGAVLWAVARFDLYAPGLEQAGLRPDRVVFVDCREDVHVLASMEDALRHGGLSAVVGEVGRADMTATRRLQLAAADGQTPALLFRRWRRRGLCPLSENSSAATRWRIGSAPSARLVIPGVARAAWQLELVRQRNGAPFSLVVEACDAEGRIALPAASADRAVAQDGAATRAA